MSDDHPHLPRGFAWRGLSPQAGAWAAVPFAERAVPPFTGAGSLGVAEAPLLFYPQGRLLAFTDCGTLPPTIRYGVEGGGVRRMLDWTNGPVYALNREAPILLHPDTVLPYLRFFLRFVRGRHGHFHLREAADPVPSGAGFTLDATLRFKDSLFAATVEVGDVGHVAIRGERLLGSAPLGVETDPG